MMSVSDVLCPFEITKCYKGFYHVCFSIQLAVADNFRMEAVIKKIYMETASYFGCSWTAVECNIRTVVARAWRVNPTLLTSMAGYPLCNTPTASEFIENIAFYIIRSSELLNYDSTDVLNGEGMKYGT